MRIALFYPSEEAAWSLRDGLRNTLRRMGHDVTDFGNAGWEDQSALLSQHDLIFVSGPEYLWERLLSSYPNWASLDVPKVGWLHETVRREDYATNRIAVDGRLPITAISYAVPTLFTQAFQDQEYGMPWVPCGVDLEMFHTRGLAKKYETAFIGSMYQKRKDFFKPFSEKLEVNMFGRGDAPTDEHYVQLIDKSKTVLNLPSMSDMSTARVFEVLACGVPLVTQRTENAGNYDMFVHGEHLLYYRDDPTSAMQSVLDSVYMENKRAIRLANRPLKVYEPLHLKLSRQGREEVVAHHSLENRIKQMLG